jgi:glutaredoxin-like YruB-family protein
MSHKVFIYSTPTCGFCHQAKEYFKEKGIEFTDYNVANDEVKAQEMIDKTGQTAVPVIYIDGTLVIGFDKEKINELLGIK